MSKLITRADSSRFNPHYIDKYIPDGIVLDRTNRATTKGWFIMQAKRSSEEARMTFVIISIDASPVSREGTLEKILIKETTNDDEYETYVAAHADDCEYSGEVTKEGRTAYLWFSVKPLAT